MTRTFLAAKKEFPHGLLFSPLQSSKDTLNALSKVNYEMSLSDLSTVIIHLKLCDIYDPMTE